MNIGNIIMPLIIIMIVAYGALKGVRVYECFIDGAREGMSICVKIFPYLLAMILAVTILRESKALDYIIKLINPIVKYIGLPGEVVPLILIKPLSGSGALGVFTDIINNYGADSYTGRVASTIMGSTETIFYTLTVYFGAVGIKKIRHTLWAAILADIIAVVMAVITVNLLFY
ncbi:spore maturation protein B [Clostridium tetanomorphum]|uniref:Spore maturation protein n=1 Tax=Clostridium tetanomorphum TaxID=1553 RepID=A0A923J1L2_CLOTT|nr:spore maturation protein [Clostridium tetanomorphum]KAJ49970.1 spore maturation protein B [Clostridium tetanomorphum DSM 665]MBC2399297.1 spore maturation protein [Clostridium tetanomorphum]MBP1866101.1 spore maturation protein B [Clostridium tetanomorphum]NRS86729.1 spore maturation protein B [Clostridium tetanomorphum]NRZ99518.1 spore maturation protein B [Clostridium tetanomorphum]